jgi:hypothetical protein
MVAVVSRAVIGKYTGDFLQTGESASPYAHRASRRHCYNRGHPADHELRRHRRASACVSALR